MVAIAVENVMTGEVETVDAETPVTEVARRLGEADIGSLVVTEAGEPTGIVTDTDLVELLNDGNAPAGVTAGDVMSGPLVTVAPDDSVGDALRLMDERDVSKLPVTEDGRLVGIVTTHDLAHYVPQLVHRSARRHEDSPESRFAVRPDTTYEHGDWEFESRIREEDGISVGDSVEFSKTLADEDVQAFAEASGDTNRLHLDDEYAAETRFGKRIVHGTLVGGLVSAALARLPGLTIYISQELSFLGPVDVGARVTATCEVVENLGRDRYVLTTDVHAEGTQVIEGEAVVLVDDLPGIAKPEREPVEE